MRVKADTNEHFHEVRTRVQLKLKVGSRSVTADDLVEAMLRECGGHDDPRFLSLVDRVAEVRRQRVESRRPA